MEKGLTKAQIISELTKSVHAGGATKRKKGEKLPKLTWAQKIDARIARLKSYVPVGSMAVQEDEHFFSRLVAWNHHKGQVRDAQIALPVIGLAAKDPELLESNLAHLADLKPREFLRAFEFAKSLGVKQNVMRRLVARWLRDFEHAEGVGTQLRHRKTLATLYARAHVKAKDSVAANLFKRDYHPTSVFQVVRELKAAPAEVVGAQITHFHLPFLTVMGALGPRLKEPEILAAVIGSMSSTELVTNMALLDKLGVKDHAITRAALNAALEAAGTKKGASKAMFKTSVAAAAVTDDVTSKKLKVLQEKQIDAVKGIDGDWLIIVDKSLSMKDSLVAGPQIASILSRQVKGKVILLFVNTSPTSYDVTGKTLDEIQQLVRFESANGGTAMGTGIDWVTAQGQSVDGIVVIGDGGENTPGLFRRSYERYVQQMGNEPSVYFYKVKGTDPDRLSTQVEMTTFDLTAGIDHYAIPNLVQTMRVGKFSLVDEIMATPLRTLNEVLDATTDMAVIVQQKAPEHVTA